MGKNEKSSASLGAGSVHVGRTECIENEGLAPAGGGMAQRVRTDSIISLLLMGSLFLTACPPPPPGGIDPITTDRDADYIVNHLADVVVHRAVVLALGSGTYDGTIVTGTSGTAAVTGYYTYEGNISCGSSCVRSETDADLTIVFDEFRFVYEDSSSYSTITGTVTYRDTTWSQQSGLSYSSGGSIRVQGSNVVFETVFQDYNRWGYADIISFDASGRSTDNMGGWCIPGNGNTYEF